MYKRFFVGMFVDAEMQRGLTLLVDELRRKHWKVEWVAPEKWHVTVVYLGNIDGAEAVVQQVEAIACEPFALQVKGLGQFPAQRARLHVVEQVHGRMFTRRMQLRAEELILPRVIYASLRGALPALHALRKQLLVGLPDAEEARTYVPHLTLGRVRRSCGEKEGRKMAKELNRLRDIQMDRKWLADRVGLYATEVGNEAAGYVQLAEKRLGNVV